MPLLPAHWGSCGIIRCGDVTVLFAVGGNVVFQMEKVVHADIERVCQAQGYSNGRGVITFLYGYNSLPRNPRQVCNLLLREITFRAYNLKPIL